MGVPNVDHPPPGANCYTLEALGHAGDFIFVVVHHTDKRVRTPEQDLSVFVPSQE